MIDRRLLKLQVEGVVFNEFRDEVIVYKEVPVYVTLFKEEMESARGDKRKNYISSVVLNGPYYQFVDRETGEAITDSFKMSNNENKQTKEYHIDDIIRLDRYNCKVFATQKELSS